MQSSTQIANRRIVLIRHAESEENVKMRLVCEAASSLIGKAQLPSSHQWLALLGLLRCELDSNLSSLGDELSDGIICEC